MSIIKHAVFVSALCAVALVAHTPAHAGDCGSSSYGKSSKTAYAQPDIVDTAVQAGTFNTLVTALQRAGLDGTLRGSGPFTVFAPSDQAFAKLPPGTVESLLMPRNRAMLQAVLSYHVVPGRLSATDVGRQSGAITANGQRVDFQARGQRISVDSARVVQADIAADNGVIHVIDRVLMPAGVDLVDTARQAGTFNTLLNALSAAELEQVLRGEGPFTVFAPTDKAFSRLGQDAIAGLLAPQNRDQLVAVLSNHVVSGRVYADAAVAAGAAHTLAGNGLRFAVQEGRLRVNGARIVSTDLDAQNGVIHVVDRVLVP